MPLSLVGFFTATLPFVTVTFFQVRPSS